MEEQLNYAAQFTALNAEGDVSDGSVDYYDFDWGNSTQTINRLPQDDSDEENITEANQAYGCVKCQKQNQKKESCRNAEKKEQIEIVQEKYVIIDI